MHVTRAFLVSNADVAETTPPPDLDRVIESTQFAHLYAPSEKAPPAAAYAYFDLRPRVETIARPAVTTAIVATLVLGFLAGFWDPANGFEKHGPFDSSALLVVLLGAPSALAAYFAQAVPSRVTNSMLYGLRLSALLPAVLALVAGGVILVGQHREHSWPHISFWGMTGWAQVSLWILTAVTGLTIAALGYTAWIAEHPREQRRDRYQGPGFERGQASFAGRAKSAANRDRSSAALESWTEDGPRAVGDRMLERAGGLSPATLRALLALRRRVTGWESYIPPALYFDSAETAPTYSGLSDSTVRNLRSQVRT
jgi:hypothetical protein